MDGIFTADPRKVPHAQVIEILTPSEAAELTFYGAEVIHPFTMEQAMNAHIPVRIKNTFNPANKGTLIVPSDSFDSSSFPKRPTAVTVKPQVTLINITSNRKSLAHGFMATVFSTLDKYGIAVDLISTSEVNVSMAVCLKEGGDELLELIKKELEPLGKVNLGDSLNFIRIFFN